MVDLWPHPLNEWWCPLQEMQEIATSGAEFDLQESTSKKFGWVVKEVL